MRSTATYKNVSKKISWDWASEIVKRDIKVAQQQCKTQMERRSEDWRGRTTHRKLATRRVDWKNSNLVFDTTILPSQEVHIIDLIFKYILSFINYTPSKNWGEYKYKSINPKLS